MLANSLPPDDLTTANTSQATEDGQSTLLCSTIRVFIKLYSRKFKLFPLKDVDNLAVVLEKLRAEVPLFSLPWNSTVKCGSLFYHTKRSEDLYKLLVNLQIPPEGNDYRPSFIEMFQNLQKLDDSQKVKDMITDKFHAASV